MVVRRNRVLAVDIGGTKIAAGLVTRQGSIEHRRRIETLAGEGTSAVVARLWALVDGVLSDAGLNMTQIDGISLAAAGPIDMRGGMITDAPNLPGWHAVPLRSMASDRYKVDSFLINDAKAAALGELEFGAAKGISDLICVTLGTGIGGGIIIGGRLYLGRSGAAGEIGHMTIDFRGPRCACGNIGCWETFASGTAMEAEAARRIRAGDRSSLRLSSDTGSGGITAVNIADAARGGDPLASSVIAWSAGHIGTGLVNLANIFNPEMIVLGGGLCKIGDPLILPAAALVKQRAFPLIARDVSIVVSTLGDDAGLLGAAAFAFSAHS